MKVIEFLSGAYRYRARRLIPVVALSLMLSACTSSQYTTLFIIGVGYTIWTDKLPTDAALEAFTGKECSTPRAIEEGGNVCETPDDITEGKPSAVPKWCYKTLGGVDCYDKEIPEFSDRLIQEP